MRYLLDTNVISDLMDQPQGPVADNIRRVGEAAVFTSIIVLSEVRFGVEKVQSRRLARQMQAIFAEMIVEPLDAPVDRHYASIRIATEAAGRTMGQNDLLIAAQALALDAIVVTRDKAFSHVPGLKVENWLRP